MAQSTDTDPDKDVQKGRADVLLGDDWVAPDTLVDKELLKRRRAPRQLLVRRSPLARKIVTFNLLALFVVIVGVLLLSPVRDSLMQQRIKGVAVEAELVAKVIEERVLAGSLPGKWLDTPAKAENTLTELGLSVSTDLYLFGPDAALVARAQGARPNAADEILPLSKSTPLTDGLDSIWSWASGWTTRTNNTTPVGDLERSAKQAALHFADQQTPPPHRVGEGYVQAVAPILFQEQMIGSVVLISSTHGIEQLLRREREQILQIFLVAIALSVVLSLLLASTIANPLSDLSAAAELGRDRNARRVAPARVRIPDLTARPDEIGRLSGAIRGMVAALYDRIDANEQFAADVAHEIKNPLASLRSATGTLRIAEDHEKQQTLLDIIDHDVRRLDRLVSDISNASRLDGELVKEEEEEFNLVKTLGNLGEYLAKDAEAKGIAFISDMPKAPIHIHGLEGRLAQVFVNLITNAMSFCEDGDAIRIWVRKRENRVLVVVEDTGPGIPEQSLKQIFKRFYSERPAGQFGNNSGLGLAISKQIVEAHGGVIWAENIHPTEADVTSDPLGARFVVGLPL